MIVQGPVKEQQPDGMSHRGFGWDPPSSQGLPMVPAEGGPKCESLHPLGTEGPEANFWLSASNIGRGGGGGGAGVVYGRSNKSLPLPHS